MKIPLRHILLEEGLLDTLKNNSGGIALGAGVLAANAGVFGDDLQDLTKAGIGSVKDGIGKMGDYYMPDDAHDTSDSHEGFFGGSHDSGSGGSHDNSNGFFGGASKFDPNHPAESINALKDQVSQQYEKSQDAVDLAEKNERTLKDLNATLQGTTISNALDNAWDDYKGTLATGVLAAGALANHKAISKGIGKTLAAPGKIARTYSAGKQVEQAKAKNEGKKSGNNSGN